MESGEIALEEVLVVADVVEEVVLEVAEVAFCFNPLNFDCGEFVSSFWDFK